MARILPRTVAEGPGIRFAVWVQGCSIRCDGCFNPHLWSSAGGTLVRSHDLAERAISADVEGVTLLGGEPFEQAAGLAEFAAVARQRGLSVMTFTGHVRAELEVMAARDEATRALLEATDLLVDGPYVAGNPDLIRPWAGSTNQGFHFLTRRYQNLADELTTLPDRLEVRVANDGSVSVNGWATVEQLDQLLTGSAVASQKRGRIR